MLSCSGRLIKYLNSIQKLRQCVLTCTLVDSECARSILETNLKNDGWKKIGFSQQTLWMADKSASDFMDINMRKQWIFNKNKICNKFRGYFAGLPLDCDVDAIFVLVICNSGKCSVTYTKSRHSQPVINYQTL